MIILLILKPFSKMSLNSIKFKPLYPEVFKKISTCNTEDRGSLKVEVTLFYTSVWETQMSFHISLTVSRSCNWKFCTHGNVMHHKISCRVVRPIVVYSEKSGDRRARFGLLCRLETLVLLTKWPIWPTTGLYKGSRRPIYNVTHLRT